MKRDHRAHDYQDPEETRLPVLMTLLVLASTSSFVVDGDSNSKTTCAGGSRLCRDKQPLSVSPAKNLLGAVNTYPLRKETVD